MAFYYNNKNNPEYFLNTRETSFTNVLTTFVNTSFIN